FRLYRITRPDPLQAVDDDRFAFAKPAADDAQALQLRSQFDCAVGDLAVVPQHQHELLAQVSTYRHVLDQHRVVGSAADQLQAGIKSRREAAVAVVEHSAAANGAGTWIHLVINEIHESQVGVTILAGEPQVHRGGIPALAFARQLAVLQVGALISLEVGIDLVGGNQGGKQRLAGVDQIAGGDQRTSHTTINGSGDPGKAEIEFC